MPNGNKIENEDEQHNEKREVNLQLKHNSNNDNNKRKIL